MFRATDHKNLSSPVQAKESGVPVGGHTTAPGGGFAVEFSPDFSEREGRWWVSRIEANQTPTQKEGTFHLSRKIALMDQSDTPPAP